MSAAWVVAALALTLLTVCLTFVIVKMLGVIAGLEMGVARLARELAYLRADLEPSRTGRPPAMVVTPAPASVLVMLEPDLEDTTSLALDITASGGLHVDVPARVLVADTPGGRALASGLPVPVEYERREGARPEGLPSVLVLDHTGSVLAKGSPGSVAELQALVGAASA
jgi:hypothetical protein